MAGLIDTSSVTTVKPGEVMSFTPLNAQGIPDTTKIFKTQYNPSSIKFSENINYSENTVPHGSQQNKANTLWNSSSAPRWSFTILINDFAVEGAIKQALAIASSGTATTPIVVEKVEKLKALLLDVNSETHEPNDIQVGFGSVLFTANCVNLQTEYKNFDQEGNPIVAQIALEFIQLIPEVIVKAKANLMSPDVTHSVAFEEGDYLTSISTKMYGRASFFTQIAKANKLDSIRGIAPGTVLYLPPLER